MPSHSAAVEALGAAFSGLNSPLSMQDNVPAPLHKLTHNDRVLQLADAKESLWLTSDAEVRYSA